MTDNSTDTLVDIIVSGINRLSDSTVREVIWLGRGFFK